MKKQLLLPLLALLLILTGCTKAACKTHSDNNGDDICDICGDSVIVVVDFYCINDLHGRILDTVAQPGIDELTTFLENARQTDDHVVMLSSGDMWQGSAESNMTRGKLVTDWMNAMDFQAMALGNHEFDWGEEYIEQNAKLADFPFLAINIFDSTTKNPVDYCVPSLLMDCSGIQIGLIGAIGDHLSSIAPDMTEGIYFETGSALPELEKAESQSLREKGADFIVFILHDGGSSGHGSSNMAGSYNISLSDGYVDLVFEGHSHQQYIYKDSFGVPHLQNGGDNTGGLSHAEVSIHAINGTVTVREPDNSTDFHFAVCIFCRLLYKARRNTDTGGFIVNTVVYNTFNIIPCRIHAQKRMINMGQDLFLIHDFASVKKTHKLQFPRPDGTVYEAVPVHSPLPDNRAAEVR